MSSSSRLRPGAPLLCLALAGCSLQRLEVKECANAADCRAAFGRGWVCGEDGYCEAAAPAPRCTEASPPDLLTHPERHRERLVLGNLMDRSLTTHRAREQSVALAVEQVNETGGLAPRELGVIFCTIEVDVRFDQLEREAAAVAAAHHLVREQGVPAIIGPAASTDTLAVFDSLANDDVLLISPSATSPALTEADRLEPSDDDPGRLWRTAPPDSTQGRAIADYLAGETLRPRVVVVHEAGAYGEGLATVFGAAYVGTVVDTLDFDTESARDAAIFEAAQRDAELVLFVSSQTADAIALLRAASTTPAFDTRQLFLTDSAANVDLLAEAASASAVFPRVRGSRPTVATSAVYQQFRASYTAAYDDNPDQFSFVAHAYDAAWLAFLGAAWANAQEGDVTGLGMARGLRRLSAGPPVPLVPASWPELRDALADGREVNVDGASGPLDFDPATEETSTDIDIWKINEGGTGFETIVTIEAQTVRGDGAR